MAGMINGILNQIGQGSQWIGNNLRIELTDAIGQVKLGGQLLPGVFQSMSIMGKIKMDKIEIPGQSGESKQPLGFEDADLSLSLLLTNDDWSNPYMKLAELTAIFQASDSQAKPYIYTIVSQLTSIWNIKEIIFDELKITDTNKNDTIAVELHFTEYKPVVVKKEDSAVIQTTPDTSAAAATGWADFKKSEAAGSAATTKVVASPAIDDDEVA